MHLNIKKNYSQHFGEEVAKPLLKGAKDSFFPNQRSHLHTVAAFINAVKAALPDVTFQRRRQMSRK